MGEPDRLSQEALERIAGVEKRLASLQELGLDTAAMRSQLAFAQTRLLEGAIGDADRVCDEVLATARRIAQGTNEPKVRTERLTRDDLAGEVRRVLSEGLLAQLMAEQQGGLDPRLEARLNTFDQHVREYLLTNHRKAEEAYAQVRNELSRSMEVLRGEIAMIRRPPNEPMHIAGLDKAVECLVGQEREGQAALATAVEEMGERLALRLESAQTEQAKMTMALSDALRQAAELQPGTAEASGSSHLFLERIAAALERQPPADNSATAVAAEVKSLAASLAQRIDQGDTVTTALRDGLAAVGQALSAPKNDCDQTETRAMFQAGFERLAIALERQVVAVAPSFDPVKAELQVLDDRLSSQGIAGEALASAVRDGFGELIQTLSATRSAEAAASTPDLGPALERIAKTLERRDESLVTATDLAVSAAPALPSAAAEELRSLVEILGKNLGNDAMAVALRDGLRDLGQVLAASSGDQGSRAAPAGLISGLERIASALEREPAANPRDAAGLRELGEVLAPRLGTDAVAAAVRDGLKDLGQMLAARPVAAPTDIQDVAQALDAVCTRLDSAHQQVAASIEAGLAKVAEALVAARTNAPMAEITPRPAPEKAADQDSDDWSAMVPEEKSATGEGSRSPTELISEHDTTRLAHKVTTGRMAPMQRLAEGDESITKIAAVRLRKLVDEEVNRAVVSNLRGQLTKLLPEVIKEPAVSQQIFSLIALEAVSHPGVLGELTGLRAFLRRELKAAVEALAKDLQPV